MIRILFLLKFENFQVHNFGVYCKIKKNSVKNLSKKHYDLILFFFGHISKWLVITRGGQRKSYKLRHKRTRKYSNNLAPQTFPQAQKHTCAASASVTF